MKEKIKRLKYALSGVFDDNLKTRQWENTVDYIIIGFIFLSTIQIFLSTYPVIVEKYGDVLHVIDIVTVAFFTVEVSLRIWCADLLDERTCTLLFHFLWLYGCPVNLSFLFTLDNAFALCFAESVQNIPCFANFPILTLV